MICLLPIVADDFLFLHVTIIQADLNVYKAVSKLKITFHYDLCTCGSGESSPSGLAV